MEKPSSHSEKITEINENDTLKVTAAGKRWLEVIYKDSLKGYVINEFLDEVKQQKPEILKLNVTKKILFKSFVLISILCFVLLYFLKRKVIQLEINGRLSLIGKSILLGFLLTTIGTLYSFYDELPIFKILVVIMLLIFLCYRISSIFKIENNIYIDKFYFNNNSKENLKYISKEILKEQITNENVKLAKTESNLNDAINKSNQIKSEQFNLIKEKLIELYGAENTNELINKEKPFVGLHKTFIKYFIGDYDEINEKSDAINKWETYLYDKGKYNRWRLKIHILNNLVTNYEINNDYK
ncbi:SH3 domain-containing protein [Flavobacterium sp. UMI-01]|uniref:SH3 domain-containing protein n=1 Tax=Flavobacterium sp. UMI-01 TaxID=1441053 RepID=UPI001C7E15C1|nr:SH3 domain-containing protein [Flavobacterium sp. UMI-01]GIZ08040.1 hypothetical protein FUMI01_07670 [Flavobacterium sp. UMI-01]